MKFTLPVRFRAIPVTTDLRAFPEAVDVFILDPKGTIMRKWLSRQTNLGAVSLQYELSQLPRFGNWTIRVVAQGQVEEKTIYIEEYYQTTFEVNVTLPAFILESERHIRCSVAAKMLLLFCPPGSTVSGLIDVLLYLDTTVMTIDAVVLKLFKWAQCRVIAFTYPQIDIPTGSQQVYEFGPKL
ncbi:hypothetical protein AVEN_177710-1 [Araneus ventricosus]|uniref:Macroglobulin domain-containing protein n=1 Tax=Araneus ventricosus TaxID=182803 RepID=A0A4Y2QJH6_ARAVE|nr:hypothetical protein AVEN_177710-1 [Araneus ventricosus]